MTDINKRQAQPYATAPKDGRVILIGAGDVGIFPMYWDPLRVNPLAGGQPGLWVLRGGGIVLGILCEIALRCRTALALIVCQFHVIGHDLAR